MFIQSRGRERGPSTFGEQQRARPQAPGFVVDNRRHDPHQRPRRRGRVEGHGQLRGGRRRDRRRGQGHRPRQRHRRAEDRPGQARPTLLPLGDSSKAQVGDPVVAIGNPFGLTRTSRPASSRRSQRQIDAPSGFPISDVIQTDAVDQPGQLRRPAARRRSASVIGINSQIATGGGQGSVGIGFAVPINTAKKDCCPS